MRRTLLVLTLLMALLAVPMAAFAQDTPTMPPVPCGDLSDDDCAFLEDSRAANQELVAYDASVNFDFSLTDVPNLPQDVSVGLVSDGSFTFSPELAARGMELQSNPPEDAVAMAAEMMDLGLSFYTDSQFDMTWDISLSEDVAALLSQQAGVAIPEALNLPLRLVDGFFYANVDDLAQVVPGLSGWIGIDMAGFLSATMEQSMATLEEGMSSMDSASIGAMMGSGMAMDPDVQAAVDNNTMVERLDDATIDGVDVAQFVSSFDLGGFLADPVVIDMIVQQAKAQIDMQGEMGGEAAPLSDEDIQMVSEMLPMLAPMLLSGIQWDTTRSIGLDDLYVYETETNIAWDLGSVIGMAGAMMGDGASAGSASDAAFSLYVSTVNSNFGGDVQVDAPEGAMIIPLDQMLEGTDASM